MSQIGHNYFGDMIALEDLTNRSICVKEKEGIRIIKSEVDLHKNQLVFVNNIPHKDDHTIPTVFKGHYVRYKRVNVNL